MKKRIMLFCLVDVVAGDAAYPAPIGAGNFFVFFVLVDVMVFCLKCDVPF